MAGRGRGRENTMPAWMTQGGQSTMQPQVAIGSVYGGGAPQGSMLRPMSNGLTHQQQYGAQSSAMNPGGVGQQLPGVPRSIAGGGYPSHPGQPQMQLAPQPPQQPQRPQYLVSPQQQQQTHQHQQQQQQLLPPRAGQPLFGSPAPQPQAQQLPLLQPTQGLKLQGYERPQHPNAIPSPLGALPQQQSQQQQQTRGQQQPVVQQAPATSAAKIEWTQHKAPDGRPYWYNSGTKVSTYTRPPEYGALEKPKPAAPTTDWKEHTAPDGRKYYYNKLTKESKWVAPEEWKRVQPGASLAASATTAQATAQQVVQKVTVAPVAATAPPQASPAAEVKGGPSPQLGKGKHMYATKDDAKLAFKQLLGSVGMASDWNWEQAMRLIVSDSRYGALKSLGEKKACFNEYAQQRKNEEKDEARAKLKRQRHEFTAMLEEHSSSKESDSKGPLRFSTARQLFEDDARWKAVSNADREELYQDYIREEEKREREAKQADRKRRAAAFRDLLLSTTSIKVDTSWRKAAGRLEGDPAYEAITRIDRLNVYQEYIKDLTSKEATDAEKKKEERRRGERRNRDAFTALLKEHLSEGRLTAKTRFKEYLPEIKSESSYQAVEGNVSGSRPKELFEDVVEDAEAIYASDRATLKEAVKAATLDVTEHTTFQEFCNAVDEGNGDAANISTPNRRLFYQEVVDRATEKAVKEKRRAAKAAEAFTDLLRSNRNIKAGMTWEEARAELSSHRDYLPVAEEERVALYEGHVAYLAERAARDAEKDAARAAKRRKEEAPDADTDRKDSKRVKKSRHRDGSSDRKEKKHKARKRDSPSQDKKSKSHKSDKRDRSDDGKANTEEGEVGSEPGEL